MSHAEEITAELVRELVYDAITAPEWTGPALWIHADLHPANGLTADGSLCGVIDFGDLCAGDPACDLAAAWTLLPDGATDRFHSAYLAKPGRRDPATRSRLGVVARHRLHPRRRRRRPRPPRRQTHLGPARPRQPATPHRHRPLTAGRNEPSQANRRPPP